MSVFLSTQTHVCVVHFDLTEVHRFISWAMSYRAKNVMDQFHLRRIMILNFYAQEWTVDMDFPSFCPFHINTVDLISNLDFLSFEYLFYKNKKCWVSMSDCLTSLRPGNQHSGKILEIFMS